MLHSSVLPCRAPRRRTARLPQVVDALTRILVVPGETTSLPAQARR
jgi:hypothetical protein